MFKFFAYTFITILGVNLTFQGIKTIFLLIFYLLKGKKVKGKIINFVNIDESKYIIPTMCPVFEYEYQSKVTTGKPINFIGSRESFYKIGQEYDLYIIEKKGKKFVVKNYREIIIGALVFLFGIFLLSSWLSYDD